MANPAIRVHMWSVVGVSVGPSVVGLDWSPVFSNKARGYCCRTPGDHLAPLQSRRAARRYLRVRGTARADSRRSGVGLAPRPQARHMPAAALILYVSYKDRTTHPKFKAKVASSSLLLAASSTEPALSELRSAL
jgi:hypothetical protein